MTVETADKVSALAANFGTFNWQALVVGAVCLAVLFLWPRLGVLGAKVPSSLVAVIVGMVMVPLFGMNVNTIGDLYTINAGLPDLHVPQLSIDLLREQLPNGITIAILAAIESLLSCVVADSMISSHHRCNMELVAQGVGNMGSVLFGGIPATGAIARTAANVKSGGRTPVAGMVHALVLLVVLVFLMPYAALIPMPTIAAILLQVAYNMSGWRNFAHLCHTASKGAVATLLLTFMLTIVFDLVTAIAVGMLITVVLFMKMVSEETEVKGWQYYCDADSEVTHLRELPKSVRVYEINGPMFFGMTDRITDISVKEFTKYLIIRMRGVPSLDSSGMNALENLYDYCEARKSLKPHIEKGALSHRRGRCGPFLHCGRWLTAQNARVARRYRLKLTQRYSNGVQVFERAGFDSLAIALRIGVAAREPIGPCFSGALHGTHINDFDLFGLRNHSSPPGDIVHIVELPGRPRLK